MICGQLLLRTAVLAQRAVRQTSRAG